MKQKVKLNVDFYRTFGKWYTSGTAETTHYLFEDGFKQDVINTQDALTEGWNNGGSYIVVVDDAEAVDGAMGFHKCILFPEDLEEYVKEDK